MLKGHIYISNAVERIIIFASKLWNVIIIMVVATCGN